MSPNDNNNNTTNTTSTNQTNNNDNSTQQKDKYPRMTLAQALALQNKQDAERSKQQTVDSETENTSETSDRKESNELQSEMKKKN